MKWADFARQFKISSEIGRRNSQDDLCVFYDDGQHVGCLRVDWRTGEGEGEILSAEIADETRRWCAQERERRNRALDERDFIP